MCRARHDALQNVRNPIEALASLYITRKVEVVDCALLGIIFGQVQIGFFGNKSELFCDSERNGLCMIATILREAWLLALRRNDRGRAHAVMVTLA